MKISYEIKHLYRSINYYHNLIKNCLKKKYKPTLLPN